MTECLGQFSRSRIKSDNIFSNLLTAIFSSCPRLISSDIRVAEVTNAPKPSELEMLEMNGKSHEKRHFEFAGLSFPLKQFVSTKISSDEWSCAMTYGTSIFDTLTLVPRETVSSFPEHREIFEGK